MAGLRRCEQYLPMRLSLAERAQVLRVANEPRFADVPLARIVPRRSA